MGQDETICGKRGQFDQQDVLKGLLVLEFSVEGFSVEAEDLGRF
jgi:hypothetical protein